MGWQASAPASEPWQQALALARRVKASPALRLAGIERYEGSLASCRHEEDRAGVAAATARLHETAGDCEREDLFECDEVLLHRWRLGHLRPGGRSHGVDAESSHPSGSALGSLPHARPPAEPAPPAVRGRASRS